MDEEMPDFYFFPIPTTAETKVLQNEWSIATRVPWLVIGSIVGIITNGIFLSIIFYGNYLDKFEYIMQIWLGFLDIMVNILILFPSIFITLADGWENLQICTTLQYIGTITTYCYSICFALIAFETYLRVYGYTRRHYAFVTFGIASITMIVFFYAIAMASVGIFLDLEYDYCQRRHSGVTFYIRTIIIFCHAIPSVFTILAFVLALIRLTCQKEKYRQSRIDNNVENDDLNLAYVNLSVYLIYVITWTPYVVIMTVYPRIQVQLYYCSVWLGFARTIFSNVIYCVANKNYRRASILLFYRCCSDANITDMIDNDEDGNEDDISIAEAPVYIEISQRQTSSHWQSTKF